MKNFLPVICLSLPMMAFGAGCIDYPYTDGMSIEDVEGGTKILATSSASVNFDDVDSIRDAKDEATLLAKAQISKFLNEEISSDETIEKIVEETKSMSGSEKEVTRQELVERVKTLRNSSQSLLRGVVVLGDCYTKGSEVRVSVGIKPETIASAGNLAGGMSESLSSQPTPEARNVNPPQKTGNSASKGSNGSLQGVESHSNTERLKDF